MRSLLVMGLSLALVCGGAGVSGAAPDADIAAEARRHFRTGTELYAKGKMQEALVEFEKANELKPDPALLFDLGMTHRSLGHDEVALKFFHQYLDAAPYAPNREEVESRIKVIEEELARRETERKRAESTLAAAGARAAEAEEAQRVARELAASAAEQAARAEEAQRAAREAEARVAHILKAQKAEPLYRKWWLWTIVGGVVAAGAVTAGVLATRPSAVPSTSQGNIVF
jgi:tetratricopeptide (TPR) repeat protein